MPDIVIPTTTKHKIRARVIVCENRGPTLAEKSVRFLVAAQPSNADGSIVGAIPTVELEHSVSVESLLSDPETASYAQAALAALEAIGVIMCQRKQADLVRALTIGEAQP